MSLLLVTASCPYCVCSKYFGIFFFFRITLQSFCLIVSEAADHPILSHVSVKNLLFEVQPHCSWSVPKSGISQENGHSFENIMMIVQLLLLLKSPVTFHWVVRRGDSLDLWSHWSYSHAHVCAPASKWSLSEAPLGSHLLLLLVAPPSEGWSNWCCQPREVQGEFMNKSLPRGVAELRSGCKDDAFSGRKRRLRRWPETAVALVLPSDRCNSKMKLWLAEYEISLFINIVHNSGYFQAASWLIISSSYLKFHL